MFQTVLKNCETQKLNEETNDSKKYLFNFDKKVHGYKTDDKKTNKFYKIQVETKTLEKNKYNTRKSN